MKKFLYLIIALAVLLPLGGCRSGKQGAEKLAEQEAAWSNVSIPVKVTVVKPQKLPSLSGTATMVRGKYVLISLRMLGFEVGQFYATPSEADVVLRQPRKLWLQTSIEDRLKRWKMPFTALQETLLGNRDFIGKLPSEIKVDFSGSEEQPSVIVTGKAKGREIEVELSWNLKSAKWNVSSPKTFSAPGSSYTKGTFEQALKSLGKIF